MHGKSGYNTRKFATEAAKLQPIILLCKRTNIGEEASAVTEEETMHNAWQKVTEAKGKLVVADFGPRNIERLLTFKEIATECGRRPVSYPKTPIFYSPYTT
ncbi:MAG: hypothetical protein JW732_07990 [Dehalococcoidia bacterium]|nr:hypothetical protein [Dehalococcoidia bacterium]